MIGITFASLTQLWPGRTACLERREGARGEGGIPSQYQLFTFDVCSSVRTQGCLPPTATNSSSCSVQTSSHAAGRKEGGSGDLRWLTTNCSPFEAAVQLTHALYLYLYAYYYSSKKIETVPLPSSILPVTDRQTCQNNHETFECSAIGKEGKGKSWWPGNTGGGNCNANRSL